MFKSIGEATYNAFTATFAKRMTHGWQAQATYTFAHGEDNAPLTGTYVVGSGDDRVSDPSNLDRERGVTPFHQTHTLRARRRVIAPERSRRRLAAALIEPQPARRHPAGEQRAAVQHPRSNLDLNLDGVTNDRPLGVDRNAGRLGRVFNLDLRYSRFIPLDDSQRIELFFEAKNLFNCENIAGVNRVVTTDAPATPRRPSSFDASDYPAAGKTGYDQRQMQLGMKFVF